MANPNIPQGVLNKVQGSVMMIDFPELNVTAEFLGMEGISLSFEGDVSAYLATMTGAVPSPNPFQMATVTMRLLKTQGLSDAYKNQIEDASSIGDVVVTPDARTLSPYYLSNCIIRTVQELGFAGTTPEFVVILQGTYQTNASLFN